MDCCRYSYSWRSIWAIQYIRFQSVYESAGESYERNIFSNNNGVDNLKL
ncbi:hypothetical protein [uncultured Methanobrevibacter sp.]|nr:hypothetical protein [uncultured Methanobrevibacter sp.]